MSTAQLLNTARNAINSNKASDDVLNEKIKAAVNPLTKDELDLLVKETSSAVDMAVKFYIKYKTAYAQLKVRIGDLALGLNQFIKLYRDRKEDLIKLISDLITAHNLQDQPVDKIKEAVIEEFNSSTDSDDFKTTVLFQWTVAYFNKLVDGIDLKQFQQQSETNSEEETMSHVQTEEVVVEKVESAAAVVEETVVNEKEMLLNQIKMDNIEMGYDPAQAEKMAAMQVETIMNYRKSVAKTDELHAKEKMGIHNPSEAGKILSFTDKWLNPQPLATKLSIMVNPLLNWF